MTIDSSISPANLLGFSSLFAYILTLLPSSLKTGFPSIKKAKFIANLLKYDPNYERDGVSLIEQKPALDSSNVIKIQGGVKFR